MSLESLFVDCHNSQANIKRTLNVLNSLDLPSTPPSVLGPTELLSYSLGPCPPPRSVFAESPVPLSFLALQSAHRHGRLHAGFAFLHSLVPCAQTARCLSCLHAISLPLADLAAAYITLCAAASTLCVIACSFSVSFGTAPPHRLSNPDRTTPVWTPVPPSLPLGPGLALPHSLAGPAASLPRRTAFPPPSISPPLPPLPTLEPPSLPHPPTSYTRLFLSVHMPSPAASPNTVWRPVS
ncbi:hypothetical protein EI94DRAFT_1826693 [Lactarius quietus]|nr:hypothetical protein EI94DRAFT_1826693 [Lactarius quietus]